MNEDIKFDGTWMINNKLLSESFYAGIIHGQFIIGTNYPLRFCAVPGYNVAWGSFLRIDTFPSRCLYSCDDDLLINGASFDFSGADLGFYSTGPTGFPGDQEFNTYVVECLSIDFAFNNKSIEILINGETKAGIDGSCIWLERSKWIKLPALAFLVELKIPLDQLKLFLKEEDPQRIDFFIEKLHKLNLS